MFTTLMTTFKSIDELNILEANTEIMALRVKILKYDELYYNQNKSEISDEEYDQLRRRLNAIEEKFPILKTHNSPSEKVGAEVRGNFPPITHKFPMFSLDNAFNQQDIEKFVQKAARLIGSHFENFDFCCEQKIDGLSLSLVYIDGILQYAATRGNGKIGEDVTNNVKYIDTIPKVISNTAKGRLEVRGEVFMPIRAFKALNQVQKQRALPAFSNPRNAAAGTLRQLDSSVCKARNLEFFAYYAISEQLECKTQVELLIFLRSIGFQVCEFEYCTSISEFIQYCKKIQKLRESLPYAIDGTVLKINNLDAQKKLGYTKRSPRHSIAFKFQAASGNSRVKDIEIGIGRTGKLVPVAIVEPIELQGALISRVTLHNFSELMSKNINTGALVQIERSGDVIPKIVKVVEYPPNFSPFVVPEYCPSCGSLLTHFESKKELFCPNRYTCKQQVLEYLLYFVSRPCFDIKGLGARQLEDLYRIGAVKDPMDIFTLESRAHLLNLSAMPGWGSLSMSNLFAAINKKRQISLRRFLTSLGMPEVGESLAETLASNFVDLDAFLRATPMDLQNIPGIGETKIRLIIDFINNDINRNFIVQIRKYVTIS